MGSTSLDSAETSRAGRLSPARRPPSAVRRCLAAVVLLCCLIAASLSGVNQDASAQGSLPDPNNCPPAQCGRAMPLIPMQSTEAVHGGLVWPKGAPGPKLLFHSRFPEYTPNDVADPAVVDAAIAEGKLTNGRNDFNASLRASFKQLTYGGFLLQQGLSQSVPTRIVANRTMERSLLFDIGHPDAFRNAGKFDTALLDEHDFALNRAAFTEVGYSRGLFYNIYCNGRVTLADGRVAVFGGHDMNSQNGLFKVQLFDPATETWAPRAEPCTLRNWRADPFGERLFAADPSAKFYPGCDPLDIRSTQPLDPSDMKYARWYPTAITLPNNLVLVLGGTDQDASVGPSPNTIPPDAAFRATKVHQVVPEVYDPKTDRTIALENARKVFPLFPQAEVVRTGAGRDDWKVCTIGGESLRDIDPNHPIDRFGNRPAGGHGGSEFDGPYTNKVWCLDVMTALRDPNRDVPGESHWTFVDDSPEGKDYCCATASQVAIDADGERAAHDFYVFSGRAPGTGAPTDTIEVMDFTAASPRWTKLAARIVQPAIVLKAVMLPDGTIFLGSGTNSRGATFDQRFSLHYQIFDRRAGVVRKMAQTTVPRGLHGNAVLLPDATVLVAGENREALVPPGSRALPQGDPDIGVPNGQVFMPPYLFNADGSLAERPVITRAPEEVSYRGHFDIEVRGAASQVASVVIIRIDHGTHSLNTGERYVNLAFRHKGNPQGSQLRVRSPKLPADAVPGPYMLFVLNRAGVPSVAKLVYLGA